MHYINVILRFFFIRFIVAHVILSCDFDVTFEHADERISHPPCNGPPYRFFVYKFANLKSIRVFIYCLISFFHILSKIEKDV